MIKKILLFILLILLIILVYFTTDYFINGKKISIPGFISSSRGTTFTQSNCDINQKIDYFSYQDTNWDKNNKFGLYVYAENKQFFELAQNLVNSNGGDWGYVLIPYNVRDRDFLKWTRVFEQLKNKHLIPIIQLWDINTGNYKEETKDAAEFLNRYIWPIQIRYISVYNEMNSSPFWYGRIDPGEYVKILDYTIDSFKKENENFFMINGAFNISADTNDTHLDAFDYMFEMNQIEPGIFEKLDGWASHSYPQPNFSGSPRAVGRNSIRAYEKELEYLKNNLGVKKDLPVFITETGWAHAEGENYNSSFFEIDVISEYFKYAFEEVWLKDDRVRAVTLFTIRYDPPYDHFSWVNKDNIPYGHFEEVKSLEKVNGNPPYVIQNSVKITGCNDF